MGRDEVSQRKVDPYHLLFQGGQFYLLGYSHERKAVRVFRLSRIRGKVSYATKAEHDFHRPADFDPRSYANRADWQLGEEQGQARVLISERIAWQIERHFGRYGEVCDPGELTPEEEDGPDVGAMAEAGDRVFLTGYSNPRSLRPGFWAWAPTPGSSARPSSPRSSAGALSCCASATRRSPPPRAASAEASSARHRPHGAALARAAAEVDGEVARPDTAIRPERFARW